MASSDPLIDAGRGARQRLLPVAMPAALQRASSSAAVKAARDFVRSMLRFIIAAAAMLAAIAGGVASSRMIVASGSPLTTDSYGPWRHWRSVGAAGADPYTSAHIAASGALRLSADSAGVYEAFSDDAGARLHSSCDYTIEGRDPLGLWWSLTVFDSAGRLIANDAERYAFTRDTIALNPNGSYIVSLGRDARPGNWLPTGGAGRLVLVFTALDPATGLSDDQRTERSRLLPVIRREGCS